MTREEKATVIEDLTTQLTDNSNIYLADISGLNAIFNGFGFGNDHGHGLEVGYAQSPRRLEFRRPLGSIAAQATNP